MYYSKCFPINQIHKEGYTIKKSCEICKKLLKEFPFYWRCGFCITAVYCHSCFLKLRKEKIKKYIVEKKYDHPFIRVNKEWKLKRKITIDYSDL